MLTAYMIAIASAAMGQTAGLAHTGTLTQDLQYPGRVAVNGGGGIYVTDQASDAVIEFAAGGAYVATYSVPGPVGIAVGGAGIYVSHSDGTVGVYDATFAPIAPVLLDPGVVTMTAPNGIAVDDLAGEVYVVDSAENMVMVFEAAGGTLVRAWGAQGSGMGEFQTPQSVALDINLPVPHVIVTDTDNFRLQVFDTAGVYQYKIGYHTLYAPSQTVAWFARSEGVAVDACNNIYVADALMGTIRAFDAVGNELDPDFIPLVGYGPSAALRVPTDMTIAGTKAYAVSSFNAAVEVFDVTCSAPTLPLIAPRPELGLSESALANARKSRGKTTMHFPDNPFDIVQAMVNGEYAADLDVNNDRQVNMTDLELTVAPFGGATVEDFLPGVTADVYPFPLQPPHMIDDLPNLCSRCHSMDGQPGGMLTVAGQQNLCLSCHSSSAVGNGDVIPSGGVANNSHPLGVLATSGSVLGPDPASVADLDVHLDAGNIRCATCHNPHENSAGSPLLRDNRDNGGLCMECHRGAGAPTIHAVGTEHGPEVCSDCHDMHASGDNPDLTNEMMFSWYNGGMVEVGFADNTIGVGAGGFVDPAAGAYGFCDVCHPYFDDTDPGNPVVSADFQALNPPHTDTMDLCTNCHAHENGFMPGLSQAALAAFGSTGKWASADACNVCHAGTHTDWMTTRHEGAWETLNAIGNGANGGCLGCHTVGFGDPDADGFLDDATTPQFEGVQCENCHGEGVDHATEPLAVHPPLHPTDSAVCGGCHTDSHHPTYDEWQTSGHAVSSENSHSSSCAACHAPLGTDPATGHGYDVECAACHNPHVQTGNDAVPDPDHDAQLRWPEVVAWPAPSNLIADTMDTSRFNICGQCHHSRGRVYTSTSRGPHHSLQANVMLGEMPMPGGEEGMPLAPNTASDHAVIGLQCVQCHMHKVPFAETDPDPAITGHSWEVNYEACAPCHTDALNAEALAEGIQEVVHARIDNIKAALGDPSTWEYSCCGGPPSGSPGQDDLPAEVLKARFIVKYIEGDASYGVHNGAYVSALLDAADTLLGIGLGDAVYLGAEACGACHMTTHAEWEGTLHAEALQTLNNIGNGANPACLGCHTVGFGETNGYVDEATTSHLAGVQCENCHGTGAYHVLNPNEATTQPFPSLAAELCGSCHTDSHHPTYDEWATSAHAVSYEDSHASSCDACHAPLRADPHIDSHAELGVECVACHDSHAQTGNAINATPPADYQLKFPQATPGDTVPSNSVIDATDPARFGLCGQCHHSRGRTWDSNSRGPHHSLQANVLLGEMPMPADQEGTPLVDNFTGPHFAEDCSRCHMETAPHEDGPPEVDAVTGHSFQMTTGGCNTEPGCHSSPAAAEAALTFLHTTIAADIAALEVRLGDPLYWEYSCCGGPPGGSPGQNEVPVEVQKVRYLKAYIDGDGSLGAHNPDYVVSIIAEMNALLDSYIAGGGTWPPTTAWWPGACCDGSLVCTDTMQADCLAAGGTWYSGEDCTTDTDGDGTPDFVCPAP